MAKDAIPGRPAMMAGIEDVAGRGFYLGNVRDVRFSGAALAEVGQYPFDFAWTGDFRAKVGSGSLAVLPRLYMHGILDAGNRPVTCSIKRHSRVQGMNMIDPNRFFYMNKFVGDF